MRILVLCLPGIGDALMATPMIKVLRSKYPKATIDVATMFPSVSYIFKNNPNINTVRYLDIYKKKRILGIFNVLFLRKYHYDVSVLAFPAFRKEYHVVQWLLGVKKRIAHSFPVGYWQECNFLDTVHIPVDENQHNVVNNMNLLKGFSIDWQKLVDKKKLNYDLTLDKEDIVFGKEYIKCVGWNKNDIIGIHPGSINSPAGALKRWSTQRYAALVRYTIKQYKKKFFIFFGPEEEDIAAELYTLINDKKNCKLIQDCTFGQSLGILSQISMLISNDNGFAHLSNALGTKSIVLFGPTNPKWCSPYNTAISTAIRKIQFIPWFRNDMKVTSPPKGVVSGMDAITVNDVIKIFEKNNR